MNFVDYRFRSHQWEARKRTPSPLFWQRLTTFFTTAAPLRSSRRTPRLFDGLGSAHQSDRLFLVCDAKHSQLTSNIGITNCADNAILFILKNVLAPHSLNHLSRIRGRIRIILFGLAGPPCPVSGRFSASATFLFQLKSRGHPWLAFLEGLGRKSDPQTGPQRR